MSELIDDDGENLAVRWFLAAYSGGVNTGHRMAIHMQKCGFGWTHPDWVKKYVPGEHLSKGGAQAWLRHLFALEAQPSYATAQPTHWTQEMIDKVYAEAEILRQKIVPGREADPDFVYPESAQPKVDLTDECAAFEREHCGNNMHVCRRNEQGDYVLPCVQDAWSGWQARALLANTAQGKPEQISAGLSATMGRIIDCLEILDKRPRPFCRDCADECGICPNDKLNCDMRALIKAGRDLLAAKKG